MTSDANCMAFLSDEVPIARANMKHLTDMYIYSELKKDACVTQTITDKVTERISKIVGEIVTSINGEVSRLVKKCQIPYADVVNTNKANTNTIEQQYLEPGHMFVS